jgi:benzodiazapine receptor
MGYAAHRAWTTGTTSLDPGKVALAKHGATLFTIQLGLNLIWMPTFFVLERPIEATVDSLALLGTNAYLTYIWSQVDDVAALVMLPYLGWLGFATYLSVSSSYFLCSISMGLLEQAGCGYLNGWSFKHVPRKGDKEA